MGASPEAEGWKDVLQLLREQNKKWRNWPPRPEKDGYLLETALRVSGRYPKKLTKGEKRVALSPPEDRLANKGKGGTSPSYAAARPHRTMGNGSWWRKRKKKIEKKREKEKKGSCALCTGP